MIIQDWAQINVWNLAAAKRKLGIGPSGSNLPKGGAPGSVLTKLSATDYDTAFLPFSGGSFGLIDGGSATSTFGPGGIIDAGNA